MSKEHAYAYEAGYRDGSINYELEHCPACKNVADLQEALAENAKLRESVKRLMTQRDGRLARAEADNAELRELARDMYACIKALCSMVENSPGCSMCLTNQDEEKPCAAADVYCRMRELGVD